MGRIKWLLLGLVLVYVLLEALLLSYRSLFQRLRPTTARTGTVTRQAHKLPVEEADVLFDEVSRFSVNMIAPRDLAAWPDGGVVVGDRRMIVFSPDGAVADDIELTYEPMCVAVDAATNVYVGMQNHIVLFPAGCRTNEAWASPSDRAYLTSLAVGAYGLFAADYAGRVVWEFDLSGSLLGRLGQGDGSDRGPRFILSTPHFDVAAGEDTVWVSNPGRRRIEAYGLDGSLKGHWGQPSTQIDGFCGKSNPSHFARLPDGRFVTSETGMRRVKIYSPNGRFLGMVAPDGAFGRGEAGPPVAVDREGQVFVLDPTAREVSVYVEKGPDE